MPLRQRIVATEQPRTFVEHRTLPMDTFTANGTTDDKKVQRVSRHVYGGEHPKEVPVQDLLRMVRTPLDPSDELMSRYTRRISSPLTAIRAKCVDCSGGSPAEVRRCPNVHCTLWPFRMGSNPFFGKLTERTDGDPE